MENVGALINLTLRMCDTQADVKSLQKSVEVMEEKLATIKDKLQQQEMFNKTQADNTLALQTQLNMLTAKIREEYESKQEPNDPKILVLKSTIPIMTISELRSKHLLTTPMSHRQAPSYATGRAFGQKTSTTTDFHFLRSTVSPKIDVYIKRNNWVMKVDQKDVSKVIEVLEL